jgi:hypothetical protein
MPLSLIAPPSVEPVSLAQATAQCRVVDAAENAIFNGLITAARQYAERITGRAFINQTWQQSFDRFPPMVRFGPGSGMRREDFTDGEYGLGRAILLFKAPLVSVTQIQYLDNTNTLQTLASSTYTVDPAAVPGVITESYTGTVLNQWPDTFGVRNAVTVQYLAGYGASGSNVPVDLQQALLLIIAHWYVNREEVVDGAMARVPMAAAEILESYRIYDERIFAFV